MPPPTSTPAKGGQTKSNWVNRNIVAVTNVKNISQLINDYIKSYNWKCIKTTPHFSEAFDSIINFETSVIVVEDSSEYPLARICHELVSHPLGSLIPVIALSQVANNKEKSVFDKFSNMELIAKPLAPKSFIPGFGGTLEKWEHKIYVAIRAAFINIVKGNHEAAESLLKKLIGIKPVSSLAARAMSHIFLKKGKPKLAESEIFKSIKVNPYALDTYLLLGVIYIQYASPQLALNLYQKIEKIFHAPEIFILDKIQANILMNNFDEAEKLIFRLLESDLLKSESTELAAKVLLAKGIDKNLFKYLPDRSDIVTQVKRNWQNASVYTFENKPLLVS